MKKYIIFMIKLYVLSLFGLYKVYSKKISIKYQDNNWNSLRSVINNNQNDGELILRFVDNYYHLKFENVNSLMDISVNANIKFIGNENGTIFDYDYENHSFDLAFDRVKEYTVSFENIIFQNFKHTSLGEGVAVLLVQSQSNYFNLVLENCTFRDNLNSVLYFDVFNKKEAKDDYSILINNCRFMYVIFFF